MYSICRHYFYVVSFDFTIISIYSNDFIFVIVFFLLIRWVAQQKSITYC